MSFKETTGYLLHHLASALDSNSDKLLNNNFGIGLSQFRILLVLEELDGASQKQIAQELSQTEASISRQIKILSSKGLVEIEGNFDNKRERQIYQTHQGHDISRQSIKLLNDYHRPVFQKLTDQEQQQLITLLKKLSSS